MINRDERRFRVADHNRDGKMTKDEFGDFIHPEDVSHMKDIVIEVCVCIVSYMIWMYLCVMFLYVVSMYLCTYVFG